MKIATAPLFIGRARAYNPGDPVDEQSLELHPQWQDLVTDPDTPAAAPPPTPDAHSVDGPLEVPADAEGPLEVPADAAADAVPGQRSRSVRRGTPVGRADVGGA